ncbi:FRG domain-containing protein [Pediococcus pentosaceus]|nr:FRG domain-containing protein [Pediococcus pentosaceus]
MNKLNEVSSNKAFGFYFRGESLIYDFPLLSSGLRNKNYVEQLHMVRKEFYKEIGYSLDEDSRSNFMAYSQHHGLPTELLDATENPLVALYFACESNLKKDGAVYIIKNDSTRSDLLTSKTYDKEIDLEMIYNEMETAAEYFQKSGGEYIKFKENLFFKDISQGAYGSLLFENTNKNSSKLKICEYILKEHRKGVQETVIHHSSNILKNKENIIELMNLLDAYCGKLKKEELEQFYSKFTNLKFTQEFKISTDLNLQGSYQETIEKIVNYKPLILLFLMAYEIRSIDFPPFPKIIYKPSITFDRMKNQQGVFIYQLFKNKAKPITCYSDDFDKNIVKTVIQKIDFEYQFIIKNKEVILSELDNIGINRKFIYPDSDNIAKYIKDKYKI